MKTNPRSTTRSLVLAALFLALAFVLPTNFRGNGAQGADDTAPVRVIAGDRAFQLRERPLRP